MTEADAEAAKLEEAAKNPVEEKQGKKDAGPRGP